MEGTTDAVIIEDTLPNGLTFVSATPVTAVAPFSFATPTSPVAGATGNISWNMGR